MEFKSVSDSCFKFRGLTGALHEYSPVLCPLHRSCNTTHKHTCKHTYKHTCKHTCTLTYTHAHTHTRPLPFTQVMQHNTQTHKHTRAHTQHTHTRPLPFTQVMQHNTQTHTCTHKQTHTHTHTHAHTCTHTHTHTCLSNLHPELSADTTWPIRVASAALSTVSLGTPFHRCSLTPRKDITSLQEKKGVVTKMVVNLEKGSVWRR